jgi:cell wall-associated NlpC family hydrolase
VPSLPTLVERPRHPTVAAEIVERALALRGSPYRVGGDRPTAGFDCSGLIRYLFGEVQVDLPRTVAEQFKVGRVIAVADVQPGDLVFFTTSMPGPSHVGLVLDQTSFVHAPGSGGVVRVERFDTPYWSTRLNGVRRVAEDP